MIHTYRYATIRHNLVQGLMQFSQEETQFSEWALYEPPHKEWRFHLFKGVFSFHFIAKKKKKRLKTAGTYVCFHLLHLELCFWISQFPNKTLPNKMINVEEICMILFLFKEFYRIQSVYVFFKHKMKPSNPTNTVSFQWVVWHLIYIWNWTVLLTAMLVL